MRKLWSILLLLTHLNTISHRQDRSFNGQTNRSVVLLFCLEEDFFSYKYILGKRLLQTLGKHFKAHINHLLSEVKLFSSPVINSRFQSFPDKKLQKF